MAPALDAENNLLFLITHVLQSYYRSQIKVGNLKFARIFPEQALKLLCLTLAARRPVTRTPSD